MSDTFVCGVDNGEGYRMIHHVGAYDSVKKTFDAMSTTAMRQGYKAGSVFFYKLPLDESVEPNLKAWIESSVG